MEHQNGSRNADAKGMLLYYSDTIHIGNPQSETCILCLWTKKERVTEKISEKNYAFIGQLYSKDYGLQILIRNLLAYPKIRNIVIVGVDLNDSGTGLVNFFEKGVDFENRIIESDVILDEFLTREKLDVIRRRIKLYDFRDIKDFAKLDKKLSKIPKAEGLPEEFMQKIVVPLPTISPPVRYPSDFSGFKARGDDFYSAYRSLMSKISRFGIFDPEKKMLSLPNIIFFVRKFSDDDKKFLSSRKKTKSKMQVLEFPHEFGPVRTLMFREIEAWDKLKDVCNQLKDFESVCVMIGEAYIREQDIEDVVELLGVAPRYKWESDPHGNLIIRVEGGEIKVTHLSSSGNVLDEISGKDKKELFRKIASANKISMIYHALDIGAELEKAEMALNKGIKYVQDKKLEL